MGKIYDSGLVDKLQRQLDECQQRVEHNEIDFRLMQRQRDWCLIVLRFLLGTLRREGSGFVASLRTLAIVGRIEEEAQELVKIRGAEERDPETDYPAALKWLSDEQMDERRFTRGL